MAACFICCDTEHDADRPAVPTGCACRESVHPTCLAEYAHCAAGPRGTVAWLFCPTCLQQYTGRTLRRLAERRCACASELGEADVERVDSAMVLSLCMKQDGEFGEAERMQREALAACTEARGADHAQALFVADFLFDTLVDGGKHEEALALAKTLVARPRTEVQLELYTACNYGKLLMYVGAMRKARRVLSAAVTRSRIRLGVEHGITRRARVVRARCVADMGSLPRARTELRAVRDLETRVLGPTHPDTVSTSFELARVMALAGQRADALGICREVVKARSARLEADHPDLLVATSMLATLEGDSSD